MPHASQPSLIIGAQSRTQSVSVVTIVTDSAYVKNGVSQWIHGWKRNGWKRKEGGKLKPLKNEDQWRRLDELLARHVVKFKVIKGHSGHAENERCDELARAAISNRSAPRT